MQWADLLAVVVVVGWGVAWSIHVAGMLCRYGRPGGGERTHAAAAQWRLTAAGGFPLRQLVLPCYCASWNRQGIGNREKDAQHRRRCKELDPRRPVPPPSLSLRSWRLCRRGQRHAESDEPVKHGVTILKPGLPAPCALCLPRNAPEGDAERIKGRPSFDRGRMPFWASARACSAA